MPVSKECGTCPFNRGFEVEPSKILTVCGRPSERCQQLQEKLINYIAEWQRMLRVAENCKSGKLDWSQLYIGDVLFCHASEPGKAYGTHLDRTLRLRVAGFTDRRLTGSVIEDSYSRDAQSAGSARALPPKTNVDIFGAFQKSRLDPATGLWEGRLIPGQLHIGRHIAYRQTGDQGNAHLGLYLQEISLINAGQDISMRLFRTDPDVHCSAPRLESEE